jgi:hypothetical protein
VLGVGPMFGLGCVALNHGVLSSGVLFKLIGH